MTALRLNQRDRARTLIDDAIAENGAMRVLWTAALSIWRDRPARRPHPPDASRLSAHIRADVGLAPEPEAVDWQRYLT